MKHTLPSPSLTLLSTLLTSLIPHTHGMCYVQNGSAVYNWGPENTYQPCSNDTSDPLSSICCAINRSNPPYGNIQDGFTYDICLPSGLCQNILTESDGSVTYAYWRDYCTDEEWSEGKCLNVCTGDGQHSEDGTAPLTPCGPTYNATKWCCGSNNTDCCSSNDPTQEMVIPISLGSAVSSTASSSSATGSPTSTSSASPASSSAASSHDSGLSTGAKAGIGVGAAIGGLLVIALGIFFVLRWRKSAKAGGEKPYELPQSGYAEAPLGYSGHDGYYAANQHELSETGGGQISEMGTEGAKMSKYGYEGPRSNPQPAELA